MRTPIRKDSDDTTIRSTRIDMKHYERGNASYNDKVVAEQNLIAKEQSHTQACGYIPRTDGIPAHEWAAMLHRNKMSRGVYTGEQRHPRYD